MIVKGMGRVDETNALHPHGAERIAGKMDWGSHHSQGGACSDGTGQAQGTWFRAEEALLGETWVKHNEQPVKNQATTTPPPPALNILQGL